MRILNLQEVKLVPGGSTMEDLLQRSVLMGASFGAGAGWVFTTIYSRSLMGGVIGGFYGLFMGGIGGLMVGIPLAGFYGTDNVQKIEVVVDGKKAEIKTQS